MRLGVGFIGSGFNTRFHIQAWQGVRDADVLGVWSPNPKNAASAAQLARSLDVGAAKAYKSIGDMVADPAIDAVPGLVAAGVTDVRFTIAPPREHDAARALLGDLVERFRAVAS